MHPATVFDAERSVHAHAAAARTQSRRVVRRRGPRVVVRALAFARRLPGAIRAGARPSSTARTATPQRPTVERRSAADGLLRTA